MDPIRPQSDQTSSAFPARRIALTIKEAAGLIAVDQATVRRLISRGELESIRFGRSVRIPIDTLSQFIERHRVSLNRG